MAKRETGKMRKRRGCLAACFAPLENSRGVLLLTSYLLIAVVAVFSIALFARSNVFLQSTERNQSRIVAFNMAEAGMDQAVKALEDDTDYAGVNYTSLATSTVQGGYEVSVTTVANNEDVRLIQATGYSPDNTATSRAAEQRSVAAYAQLQEENLFDFAVFAKDSMQIVGNARVDSYDSRNGAYGGSNVGSLGDIGTNSTNASTLDLTGNVSVLGDAQVGPDGDPSEVIDLTGRASISGTQSALTTEKVFESAETEEVSLGALNISGSTTRTYAGGTYHFSSISISGTGSLRFTGPATVYVSGAVSVSGNGITTADNSPPNFLLYVTTDDTVQITGNGNFYGAIYAPDSQVNITGNGGLYGAVVSESYNQVGNGGVHFDEALIDVGGTGRSTVSVLSWWENHTVAGS